MRWSVLLPTHDSPQSLGFAIDAVLAQSETDFELIMVGDGVTDETRGIIADRADARITFHDLPKADGFGYAHRRAVLERARGDYIAFASDDDLVAPHHLAVLGALLDQGNQLAYSRPIWCVPSGHLVPLSFDLADPWVRDRFGYQNFIPSVFVAVSRTALVDAGGWPVDVAAAADWTLWRRILGLPNARVGYDSSATAVHFRARRRNSDHPAVDAILALPERESWWPSEARLSGDPLQGANLDREWWSALTHAAQRVEHHVALVAVLGGITGELQETAVNDARAEERRTFESSTSWKVTRPLRWLGRTR